MEPIGAIASIATIITAATEISSLVKQLRIAPNSVSALESELELVQIVFRALQRLIDRTTATTIPRAAMLNIEDITFILTQTSIVFSQIQTLLEPFSVNGSRSDLRRRFDWTRHKTEFDGLVGQLQRHKISLSLLLHVIQCTSDLDARETAHSLHQLIDEEVEADADIARRLSGIEMPPNIIEPGIPDEINDETHSMAVSDPGNVDTAGDLAPLAQKVSCSDVPEPDPRLQATFEIVLATSRVYHRVRDRDVDDRSSIATDRSHAWSVLSATSLAELSIVAVVSLPLDEQELRRLRRVGSVSPDDDLELSGQAPSSKDISAQEGQITLNWYIGSTIKFNTTFFTLLEEQY
ncbi:MAG: hypothetical protein Q9168_005309 [Polycauliona sp. 1 TL-2023]